MKQMVNFSDTYKLFFHKLLLELTGYFLYKRERHTVVVFSQSFKEWLFVFKVCNVLHCMHIFYTMCVCMFVFEYYLCIWANLFMMMMMMTVILYILNTFQSVSVSLPLIATIQSIYLIKNESKIVKRPRFFPLNVHTIKIVYALTIRNGMKLHRIKITIICVKCVKKNKIVKFSGVISMFTSLL